MYALLQTVQGNVLYDQVLDATQIDYLGGIAVNAYGAYYYEFALTYPAVQQTFAAVNILSNDLVTLVTAQNVRLTEIGIQLENISVHTLAEANAAYQIASNITFAASLQSSVDTFNTTALLNEMNTVMNGLAAAIKAGSGWDALLDAPIGESTWKDAVVRASKMLAGFGVDDGLLRKYGPSAGMVSYVEEKAGGIFDELLAFSEGALSKVHDPAVKLAQRIVDGVHSALIVNTPATPERARERALEALSVQIGLGIEAHLIALAVESVPYLKHIGFPQLSAFLVDNAGFKKVADAVVGNYLDASVSIPGRYDALSALTPSLPPPLLLADMLRKREVSLDDYRKGLQYAGFGSDWQPAMENSAYDEPTLRALGIVLEDVNVDPAWLIQAVRRTGLNDLDADKVHSALLQRTTKSSRGRLVAAAVKGLKMGFMSVADADQEMERAGLRPDARGIEIRAAQWDARFDLINDQAALYMKGATDGLIDVETLRTLLTAIGVEPSRLDVLVGKVTWQLSAKHLQTETADALQAVRAAQSRLIPLYRDLFRVGAMSADAFGAALRAIGLRDELVSSIVSLEQQRYLAGLIDRSSRDAATFQQKIIAERTRILGQQVKAGLISIPDYQSALHTLGLATDEVNDLVLEARVRTQAIAKVRVDLSAEANAVAVKDETRRLLIDLFRAGLTDAAALNAGLVSAGFSMEVSELITEREVLATDLAGAA